jgi:4-hydroxy-2-oxoheptanedioate aldolase
MKTTKEFFDSDVPCLGTWISIADPNVIEIASGAGFDYVRIDNEYVPFDPGKLAELIRTANHLNLMAFVRISRMEDIVSLISFGANGVIVPDCNTVERTKEAIERVKYAPFGSRGMHPGCRAAHLAGIPGPKYLREGNNYVSLTIQIEDIRAADCIDDILSLDGIDMVSSGRNDISQSLGVPGESTHPKVLEMEDLIIRKSLQYGKVPVILVSSKEEMRAFMNKGVKVFTIANDEMLLRNAMKSHLSSFL